jgi:prophage regulatory protein
MGEEKASQALFLTVSEVADRYSVSVDSIWRWKREGTFPAGVRLGKGCTRWRLSDLEEHERTLQACFAWSIDGFVESTSISNLNGKPMVARNG